MLIVDTKSYDPYYNLASEEYFFRKFEDEILFLYINSPSVIIGKHQNAYEEVNLEYVTANRLPVLRRLSGGGTVYHDKGNLNFTFIKNRPDGRQVSFLEHTRPVISFLEEQGLSPYVGDKNEIREDGLKFSGNAEHLFKNRVLHHGTILFDSRLSDLGDALQPGSGKYISRAVQSNRTRVGNLAPRLRSISDIAQLKESLTSYIANDYEKAIRYSILDNDDKSIKDLVKVKYSRDEWVFGYGPDYKFRNAFMLDKSELSITIEVKKGLISSCKIEGTPGWENTAGRMLGKPHLLADIRKIIKTDHPDINDKIIFRFFN